MRPIGREDWSPLLASALRKEAFRTVIPARMMAEGRPAFCSDAMKLPIARLIDRTFIDPRMNSSWLEAAMVYSNKVTSEVVEVQFLPTSPTGLKVPLRFGQARIEYLRGSFVNKSSIEASLPSWESSCRRLEEKTRISGLPPF